MGPKKKNSSIKTKTPITLLEPAEKLLKLSNVLKDNKLPISSNIIR